MRQQENSFLIPRILCFFAAIWVVIFEAWWLGPWGPDSSWLIPFWFPGLLFALLGFCLLVRVVRLTVRRRTWIQANPKKGKRTALSTAEWEEVKEEQARRRRSIWLTLGAIVLLGTCVFIARRQWPMPGIPVALAVLAFGGRYWNSMRADPLVLLRKYDLVTFKDGTKSVRPARSWQAFFPLGWRVVRGTVLEGSRPRRYLWIWAILPLLFVLASTIPVVEEFPFSWPWFLGLALSCSYWFDWLVVSRFLNFALDPATIYAVLPKQRLHRVCTIVYEAPLRGIARRTAEEQYFGCEDWNPDLDLITLGGGGQAKEKFIARWMPDDEYRVRALALKDALKS